MRVELLAVGTELLFGDIVNGNAAWLGQRLAEVGIDIATSVVVGDNVARIAQALTDGLARADAVVVTGGLGPTQDDLTREGVARAAGVGLRRDGGLAAELRMMFAARGRRLPDINLRQADLPAGAAALPNGRGTAPGVRAEVGAGVVYCLPGVPHEMEAMFTASVLPDLLSRAGEPAVITHRVLRTAGIFESAVAEALSPLVARLEGAGNPTLAFLASKGEVRVRLTAKARSRAAAQELLAPAEAAARAALGDHVYGADDDTLAGVVHALLLARRQTVAVAESLTGGLLGAALTEAAGSSVTFRGGVTPYATPLKASLLAVPAELLDRVGPVAAETAVAMAEGVRRELGATWGVAVTGVAGPEEQDGHPAGEVHVGLTGPGGARSWQLRLVGDRSGVRTGCVVRALDLLRRELLAGP